MAGTSGTCGVPANRSSHGRVQTRCSATRTAGSKSNSIIPGYKRNDHRDNGLWLERGADQPQAVVAAPAVATVPSAPAASSSSNHLFSPFSSLNSVTTSELRRERVEQDLVSLEATLVRQQQQFEESKRAMVTYGGAQQVPSLDDQPNVIVDALYQDQRRSRRSDEAPTPEGSGLQSSS